MLLQHVFVIHLINVIARQQDNVTRVVALDNIDVLEHRVGRAGVPAANSLGHALARGQDIEALVAFGPEKVPAAL